MIKVIKKILEENAKALGALATIIVIVGALFASVVKLIDLVGDNSTTNGDILVSTDSVGTLMTIEENIVPNTSDLDRVSYFLDTAEERLLDDLLSTPKGDSAFDYYQKVIDLDKYNLEASKGIMAVQNRYMGLINSAMASNDFDLANVLANRLIDTNANPEMYSYTLESIALSKQRFNEGLKTQDTLERTLNAESDVLPIDEIEDQYKPNDYGFINQKESNYNDYIMKVQSLSVSYPELENIVGVWFLSFEKNIYGPLGKYTYGHGQYRITIAPDSHISISNNWFKGVEDCSFNYKGGVLLTDCDLEEEIRLVIMDQATNIQVLYKDQSLTFQRGR